MPGEPSSLVSLKPRYVEDHRWGILCTVIIGNTAALMAATTINVAVPAITLAFGLDQQQAQWLATTFMAAMTVSMLATPWVLQRLGYWHGYAAMLLLLALGGLIAGFSRNFELLLSMRIVQGLAAGVLQTIPGIIVMQAFGAHEQGRATGVWGFGIVLAPAVGPGIGGLLIEWFDWPAIFFFVIPFCMVSFEMARRFLRHVALGGDGIDRAARLPDAVSLVVLCGMLALLLDGLVKLHGSRSLPGLAYIASSAALLAYFLQRQSRVPSPLLQMRLFTNRVYNAGSVVALVYGAGLYGSTYLLPLFMLEPMGLPASTVGFVLLPAALALGASMLLAGRLADRQPVNRALAAGLAVMAASFAAMLAIDSERGLLAIIGLSVAGRLGLGFVIPLLNLGVARALEPGLVPAGVGTVNFFRQIGGVIGVNLVGIGLEWRIRTYSDAGPAGTLRAFHEVFLLMALLTLAAAPAARWMAPSRS